MMPSPKRKEGSGGQADPKKSQAVMKKPASKLESAIELLSDANNEKGGTNEEQAEEEEAEVDPLLDLDAGRDRSKAKKMVWNVGGRGHPRSGCQSLAGMCLSG